MAQREGKSRKSSGKTHSNSKAREASEEPSSDPKILPMPNLNAQQREFDESYKAGSLKRAMERWIADGEP